jgi:tetratricopeptide (TPR) repeat protein
VTLFRTKFLLATLTLSSWALLLAMPQIVSTPIRTDLSFGRADQALERIDGILSQNASDAEAHHLRCRVLYQEQRWDDAIAACQQAVALDPSSSEYHLWLGRAFGEKADRVSFIQAYKLARRVRGEFETAVRLNPRSVEALSDLGEFDVDAPGIVGGGLAKAETVAAQLDALSPAAAHQLRAGIAEQRKDYALAENEFKEAITASTTPARAWMDLASFYRRRNRIDDMVAAVHAGAALDRHPHDSYSSAALVDGASLLARTNSEPDMAIDLLRQYLASPAPAEEAPAFAVRAQLARLLLKQGDQEGAEREIAQVHALASGYRDAQLPATNTGR